MTESQRQGDRESHEDTIKETIKESASAVFSFYQNNFELLTQYNSSKLGDMIDDYSAEWVLDALKVCVDNGKKSISYAAGILKRWKREGRRDNCEKTEPQAPQDNPPEIDESLFVPNPYAGRRR